MGGLVARDVRSPLSPPKKLLFLLPLLLLLWEVSPEAVDSEDREDSEWSDADSESEVPSDMTLSADDEDEVSEEEEVGAGSSPDSESPSEAATPLPLLFPNDDTDSKEPFLEMGFKP